MAHALAMVPVPALGAAATAAVWENIDALAAWHSDHVVLTFRDVPREGTADAFGAASDRLRAVKADLDPRGVFVAAHSVD